jgi:hypothetical protein
MATQIKSNGEEIENYPSETLVQMQEAVGGYIEAVYTKMGQIIIANEEGLLRGLPVNVKASQMAQNIIVGDVLIMSIEEWRSRD